VIVVLMFTVLLFLLGSLRLSKPHVNILIPKLSWVCIMSSTVVLKKIEISHMTPFLSNMVSLTSFCAPSLCKNVR
jgi:hypothetical protein